MYQEPHPHSNSQLDPLELPRRPLLDRGVELTQRHTWHRIASATVLVWTLELSWQQEEQEVMDLAPRRMVRANTLRRAFLMPLQQQQVHMVSLPSNNSQLPTPMDSRQQVQQAILALREEWPV